jgi:hypothetical protein
VVERHWRKGAATLVVLLAVAGALLALLPRPPGQTEKPAEDPDRAVQDIERQLVEGQPVPLIDDQGPPRWHRWGIHGGGNLGQSPDGGVFLSSVATSLLELVRDPRCPGYKLTALVRHDFNPSRGRVGVYFGYQDHGKAPEAPRATFYVLRFSDRGTSATEARGPAGEVGSRVELEFHYFEPKPHDAFHPVKTLHQRFFRPALPEGRPGPWRELAVEVRPEKVAAFWAEEGPVKRIVELPTPQFLRAVRGFQSRTPGMKGIPIEFEPRTSLGLYVYNSSASFRRVVVTPLD